MAVTAVSNDSAAAARRSSLRHIKALRSAPPGTSNQLLVDDVVEAINGTPVAGLDYSGAVALVGESNQTVDLTVARGGSVRIYPNNQK